MFRNDPLTARSITIFIISYFMSLDTLSSCVFVAFRSWTGFYCLPTSLCQHASESAVGCVVLLHAALPRTGQ